MLEPVLKISQFIAEAFLQIWPYGVVTVPLAVAVQMSGACRYIKRAFEAMRARHRALKIRVNDHPQSGWLGFYRHRR